MANALFQVIPMDPKHLAFCEEYLITLNATEAYSRTHPKAKRNTCWTGAYETMRNPEVAAYIKEKLGERAMESEEVLARLAEQARGSLAPFIKVDGEGSVWFDFSDERVQPYIHLIKNVTTQSRVLKTSTAGKGKNAVRTEVIQQWVKVELNDQQSALVHIGRHLKLFTDRVEHDMTLHVEGFEQIVKEVYGD